MWDMYIDRRIDASYDGDHLINNIVLNLSKIGIKKGKEEIQKLFNLQNNDNVHYSLDEFISLAKRMSSPKKS